MDVETDALEGERGGAETAAGVRPRRWPKVAAKVIGVGLIAVFAVIGVVATGYVAWNGFPQSGESQAAKCADDRRAAELFVGPTAPQTHEQQLRQVRLGAHVVAAAPDCFSPENVAMAREFLARQ